MDWGKTIRYIAIATGLATLCAYAGLIPLGSWRDEYFALSVQNQQGFVATMSRIVQWSPRPLSELVIYLYGLAVEHFGSPVITRAIAPFWIVFTVCVILPVWRKGHGLLAATTLIAMLLMGHTVAEVFYWPFAVFAYLPTVTAAATLLTLDWGGWLERRGGRVAAVIALLVAAGCSEVGALFTLIYATLSILAAWRTYPRYALLLLLPLLLSLVILYAEFAGRVALGVEVFGDPNIAHHPLKVLVALKDQLFFQLFKGDGVLIRQRSLDSGIATKLLFLVGVYFAMSAHRHETSPAAQRLRLVLTIASLATAALILTASLYNFGVDCCERHDTMKQVYVFVALGSFASFLAMRLPARSAWPGPLALLLAMLIPLWTTAPKLVHDYRNYSAALQARQATWQSGHSPGPSMQVVQVYPGLIAGGVNFPPQTYQRTSSIKGLVDWILLYHNKQSAEIEPPIGHP